MDRLDKFDAVIKAQKYILLYLLRNLATTLHIHVWSIYFLFFPTECYVMRLFDLQIHVEMASQQYCFFSELVWFPAIKISNLIIDPRDVFSSNTYS